MSHFDTLGVAPGATREEILLAWRRLAIAHHPDRGGIDPSAFIEITKAKDALLAQIDSVGLFDDIFLDISRELRK